MTVTIEMPEAEINQIKQLTNVPDGAQAVVVAAKEFLRVARLRQLKAVSGKVDFESNWEDLERLELAEADFPRS